MSAIPSDRPVSQTSPSGAQKAAIDFESTIARLKVIDALRNGDVPKLKSVITNPKFPENGLVKVMFLAIQVAPVNVIKYLLETYPSINVNSVGPPSLTNDVISDGDTLLHVASRLGRAEAVAYLLSHKDINDTIVNKSFKMASEVAKTPELSQLMEFDRMQYTEKIHEELRLNFAQKDTNKIETLLSNPRASALIDINAQDSKTGSTPLHDFVKAKNIDMVQFILSHGGDPFRRNSKGVLPVDVCKDDAIKKLLKSSVKSQPIMNTAAGAPPSENPLVDSVTAPSMKGYLRKWTNLTTGYKLRWFVLENGILSYYKSQDDAGKSCRGSINMRLAKIRLDNSEELKFVVIGKGSVKYHLKANHPVETNRWVWALTNAAQYAKDIEKAKKQQGTGTASLSQADGSLAVYRSDNDLLNVHRRSLSVKSVGSSDSRFSNSRVSRSQGLKQGGLHGDASSFVSTEGQSGTEDEGTGKDAVPEDDYYDDEDEDEDDYDDADLNYSQYENIGVTSNALKLEVVLVSEAVKIILNANRDNNLNRENLDASLEALQSGVNGLSNLLKEYIVETSSREKYFRRQLSRELKIKALWEENIKNLENEYEDVRQQLYETRVSKKNVVKGLKEIISSGATVPKNDDTTSNKASVDHGNQVVSEEHHLKSQSDMIPSIIALAESDDQSDSDDEFFDPDDEVHECANSELLKTSLKNEITKSTNGTTYTSQPALVESSVKDNTISELETIKVANAAKMDSVALPAVTKETAKSINSTESAFSDTVDESKLTSVQKKKLEKLKTEQSFLGYEDPPRARLKIANDDRPKISLWAVLKSLIGKDMTRMTLPVSFNECTSLLQRCAEDMEYTSVLDKAVTIEDSLERLAYVGAFAASEYASTIDRIAKPFNPLLGETYEYARPDKGFRFFIEQVSHHPPISAAMAESPFWDYYGESAVKSKFNGRSFDINPLGVWFLNLRPSNGKIVEETYSWKKVTSSVVGIIVGNPVVDNYGEMVIQNHITNEKCVLKFKSRGWTNANSYEIKGNVYDKNGESVWTIGGRWNDKLYAKRTDGSGSKKLLWQVNPRPEGIPFNLTPFAVTLNALTENLERQVARTDTRLRPDQRAMEEARYDDAAQEKNRVEEKQRTTKKQRDAQGEVYGPKWFEKSIHPITGDEYWKVKNHYWLERAKGELIKNSPDIF
ncbi:hypothetical protein NADFUDRAFT_44915 [Nadsonia fulvescens var. elongata DSM 6958]|uniref:PH domain-containing protein n=1 Tax=Nadsonia fulvescens var. elongata DSM 6958 TaxID=857566 RepID=A0A1E3PTQ7_9ASCO|nr:hypothetical protein NADFUDRAFT_44915 [Nadsonia fulvescens var. elongata DSM 6958]